MNVALQKVSVWNPWQRRSAGSDSESVAVVPGGRVLAILGRERAF